MPNALPSECLVFFLCFLLETIVITIWFFLTASDDIFLYFNPYMKYITFSLSLPIYPTRVLDSHHLSQLPCGYVTMSSPSINFLRSLSLSPIVPLCCSWSEEDKQYYQD